MMRRLGIAPVLLLVALIAFAAWPKFVTDRTNDAVAAGEPTPAAVNRDDLTRDAQVAFWEGAAAQRFRNDVLTPRNLSEQYMQRYRERGDIGDVTRALAMAQREEAVAPHSNLADGAMASVLLTLHRFREARAYIRDARAGGNDGELLTREAGLDLELGDYGVVPGLLDRLTPDVRADIGAATVEARYDELTGKLERASTLLHRASVDYDAHYGDASAQARAWYHFRAGEVAFELGRNDEAIADEQGALAIFPTFNLAYNALARFELATQHPREALDAATKGAAITPLPETLGYEADAQRALGDSAGAARTQDLIITIERIGDTYRVSDRLISIYYAEHGIRLDDALRIARREIAVRGDEIYAQDTLAWAAAMDGRWPEARTAMKRALRWGTQDARLQFHAGMIALHFGDVGEAKRRLQMALARNPQFHPVYADEARSVLAKLQGA
jgi:tetratricopeptide (TPR) repeat protein